MKTRKYYSRESAHGSLTSHGFANDTIVRVFNNKESRDDYIRDCENISCSAITRSSVTKEATNWSLSFNCDNAPTPFSGEYWGIVQDDYDYIPDGQIGIIQCCDSNSCNVVERFYK